MKTDMKSMIARILVGLLVAAVTCSASAQFTPGQILSAGQLNSALAVKTNNASAAITGGTITGLSSPIPVASGGTGGATVSAALANLGSLPSPLWGTYGTVFQPAWFNLNNFPASSMNGNNTHGTASAFTASIDTPSTDTVWTNSINTGLAGYARSASPVKGSVGVFGSGMSNANNTQQWGANFVATNFDAASGNDTGQTAFLTVGMESDVYLNGASGLTGTAIGVKIVGAMASIPSGGAYGIEIAPANVAATLGWSAGIAIDDAPNTTAMSVGAAGIGNNVASQTIQFKSRNSGGTSLFSSVYEDATGNVQIIPSANMGIQSSLTLGVNGSKAGNLSLANAAGGGGNVTLQNGATGTPWNFNFPANAGSSGQVLTSQGGGSNSMTWVNSGTHGTQEVDAGYTFSTPLTGTTVTLSSGTETAVIAPAGTLAALTVALPSCTAGYDGSIARYSSSQAITALTVSSASSTVSSAPASLAAGVGNAYLCRGSTTTWYRLY